MVRKVAVTVLLLGAAVWLTEVARRRAGPAPDGHGRTHVHHCFLCAGEWSHQRPCCAGPAWLCPWCLAGSRAEGEPLPDHVVSTIRAIGPARRRGHAHRCAQCLTTWSHRNGSNCTAGDLAVLPECPGCRQGAVASRASSVDT